jgi:hypothetical protein
VLTDGEDILGNMEEVDNNKVVVGLVDKYIEEFEASYMVRFA